MDWLLASTLLTGINLMSKPIILQGMDPRVLAMSNKLSIKVGLILICIAFWSQIDHFELWIINWNWSTNKKFLLKSLLLKIFNFFLNWVDWSFGYKKETIYFFLEIFIFRFFSLYNTSNFLFSSYRSQISRSYLIFGLIGPFTIRKWRHKKFSAFFFLQLKGSIFHSLVLF